MRYDEQNHGVGIQKVLLQNKNGVISENFWVEETRHSQKKIKKSASVVGSGTHAS